LASCMITVMAIKAEQLGVSFVNVSANVGKIMSTNPRRISKVSIAIDLPIKLSEKDKLVLEKVGNTCPVHNSLDPKLIIEIKYNWI
jgi:putative redox protein